MESHEITRGRGRTEITLLAHSLGGDLVVYIYNRNAHIGAVAVGEYDFKSERTSVSLITRLGHKDDAVAQKAAYLISKSTHRPVCVIAGIHLDDITQEEIRRLVKNANRAVEALTSSILTSESS